MAKTSVSRIFVWAILAMIIVGLIGFGSTNLSGSIRTIGKVGDKEIPINTYAGALQQEINALSAQAGSRISFAQAQLFGLDQQVLGRLVATSLLDAEMDRIGISVGDEVLRQQLLQISSFLDSDGNFDRQAYGFAIQNAGMTESEFEAQIRDEITRSILQRSLLGNIQTNDTFARTFVSFLQETRDLTWAELTASDLDQAPAEASEAELRAHYEANIEAYTIPETMQITYAWLTPEMILDSVELDEQSLRDAYERRIDEFDTPERRLVERLVFVDEASAAEALERLNAGTATFEDLVTERGLQLINVDLGDVTEFDLFDAGELVFSIPEPGIVGPAPSELGPALFRVNAILSGRYVSFEDAQPLLREELAYDRATRVIDSQITDFEDLLAAGATLEELAADTDMQLGQIGYRDDVVDGIAGYAAFRELANAITPDAFPEIDNLEDGGVFAMRLDTVDDPRPEAFEDVRESVAEGLNRQRLLQQLEARATELATAIAQGASFESLGLTSNQEAGISRNSEIGGTPPEFASVAFEMPLAGELDTYATADSVILFRLDAINSADLASEESAAIVDAINQQSSGEIEQEIFDRFIDSLRLRTVIDLDQRAINAVNANFQ